MAPRESVIAVRLHAKVRIRIAGTMALKPSGMLPIMSVNFIILSVGLTIIGAGNPLASGVIIALVDALPLLGCGTVLIPWAVWCFLSGEAVRGVGLLILLGVIYVVRQFLEPRVIGRMTGVHPFVALAAVYIGLKLGGVGGMILAPIILMCVKQYTLGQREEKQT